MSVSGVIKDVVGKHRYRMQTPVSCTCGALSDHAPNWFAEHIAAAVDAQMAAAPPEPAADDLEDLQARIVSSIRGRDGEAGAGSDAHVGEQFGSYGEWLEINGNLDVQHLAGDLLQDGYGQPTDHKAAPQEPARDPVDVIAAAIHEKLLPLLDAAVFEFPTPYETTMEAAQAAAQAAMDALEQAIGVEWGAAEHRNRVVVHASKGSAVDTGATVMRRMAAGPWFKVML